VCAGRGLVFDTCLFFAVREGRKGGVVVGDGRADGVPIKIGQSCRVCVLGMTALTRCGGRGLW